MAVPYTFGNTPTGENIPLSNLDANFAYLSTLSSDIQILTITTTNVIPPLSSNYAGFGLFLLIVNGSVFVPAGSPPPFTVYGNVITWTSTVWSVNPGDSVVAVYASS